MSFAAAARYNVTSPFMGWMAWQAFRCADDCNATSLDCVNERLLVDHANLLVSGGFAALGYNRVHVDDCAVARARDPVSNVLPLDPVRFPSGLSGVAAQVHAVSIGLGVYTAESTTTCEGFPGSRGYEAVDAAAWAAGGVDFVKADGCGDPSWFPQGYPLLGAALDAASRTIEYSCSWPAYDGTNETAKNWTAYIAAGCVTGRTWADMQCAWDSPPPLGGTPLLPIIDHYGDYAATLQAITRSTGFLMDGDELLAGALNPDTGAPCLTLDQERTQLAIWAIMALPLVMGNDLRNMRPESAAILSTRGAIAINQDGVVGGLRVSPKGATEVWARNLSDGSVAVALFNKLGLQPQTCDAWNFTEGWFFESGTPCNDPNGNLGCFAAGESLDSVLSTCCENPSCAGLSWSDDGSGGCYKVSATCPYNATGFSGFFKPVFPGPPTGSVNITVDFALLGLCSDCSVTVLDVWENSPLGNFVSNYTASNVPLGGTALVLLRSLGGGLM